MAKAGDSDVAEQIKSCFREFDKDGNGAITRRELQNVLRSLCRPGQALSGDDIDKCLSDADKNDNGVIEYEEFVDWLMKPGSRVQASNEGTAAFDFEAVLWPLFEVFDRNSNGAISPEEFEECFLILQNSLKLCCPSKLPDPNMLERSASEIFRSADVGADHVIDFQEFVSWQRNALEKSGLLNADLQDLVPALARQLERVFKFSEADERGELTDKDSRVLSRIIDNVGSFTRDIWNDTSAAHNSLYGKKHYSNRWSDPPVGVNVERLIRQHLKVSTLRIHDVKKFEVQVFCLPELVDENQTDLTDRRWIARVSQGKVVAVDGKPPEAVFEYYVYEDLAWSWNPDAAELFQTAHDSFSLDMRFYCLLKTQANFGVSMRWAGIQAALKMAVDFGLMRADQHRKYNDIFETHVLQSLRDEGILAGLNDKQKKDRLEDTLNGNLKVAPRSVMTALVEQSVFGVSSKLADCIDL